MKKSIAQFLLLTVFFSLLLHIAFGQKTMLQKADELFNRLAYSDAIVEYENILKKYPDLTSAKMKLAECYRLTSRSEKAEFWYGEIVKSKECKPLHKFYYGQALMNNGKYDEAKSWIKDYNQLVPTDKRGEFALKTLDNLPLYLKDTASFFIWKLIINSPNADFSPTFYNNGIVFASSRQTKDLVERKHSWTNQPFLNLYYSKGKGNTFLEVEPFATDVQIKFNDGPVCFNREFNEVYITRNNVVKKRVYSSEDGVTKLKLFHSKLENGQWKAITPFKYNNDEFNCAHPFISSDNKTLFFTSDMPGGFGGMDLYICKRDSVNAEWKQPVNLGEKINTLGNEVFPYLHDDGTFLFSSNGRDGLGGLDVFYCKMKDGEFLEAKNYGAPVNGTEDDFGIIFDKKTHYGYFSSNRESKGIDDDIYSFRRMLKVKGIVVEKGTDKIIPMANVKLKNSKKDELELITKEDGKFEFPVDFDESYSVEGDKEFWSRDIKDFNTIDYFPTEDFFVKLELEKQTRKFNLIVKVIDRDTKKPIQKASIGVDQTDVTLGYTDKKGIWMQPLTRDFKTTLIITKGGYDPKVVSLSNVGQRIDQDFEVVVELKKGADVGEFARWYKIIYYDFDKANIRPDAVPVLMEVLQFVKSNPEVRLLMNSYCDSRGSNTYNEKLSMRRAKAATQWLVNNGASDQVVEKMEWGGETMLMNKCADGANCTEDDHQKNRRTEIRVIRVDKSNLSSK